VRTGGQIQAAYVGDIGNLRFDGNGALVVVASGKTSKAFFAQRYGNGVNADRVAGGS
jgi:hypothetical protein